MKPRESNLLLRLNFGLERSWKKFLTRVWPILKAAVAKLLNISGLTVGSYPLKNIPFGSRVIWALSLWNRRANTNVMINWKCGKALLLCILLVECNTVPFLSYCVATSLWGMLVHRRFYPMQVTLGIFRYPFIRLLGGERHCESSVIMPKNTNFGSQTSCSSQVTHSFLSSYPKNFSLLI